MAGTARRAVSIRIPPPITVEWEWIDPGKANEYLASNIETNRHIRRFWLDRSHVSPEGGLPVR